MKIAVTGATGRLGEVLVSFGCEPLYCNVTSIISIQNAISYLNLGKDDVIIHCAAVTDVDGCEIEMRKLSTMVNVYGTQKLRELFDGRIIYLSTDYIFDGKRGNYTEKDDPNPINHYGETKLWGEDVIREYNFPHDTIVRTTLLYGGRKPDFVSKVLAKLKLGNEFTVPSYLYGSPTNVFHLAEALMYLSKNRFRKRVKVINIAGSDILSRYEFACKVAEFWGFDKSLIKPTTEREGLANRPPRAGLDVSLAKSLGIPIYNLNEGLWKVLEKRKWIEGRTKQ